MQNNILLKTTIALKNIKTKHLKNFKFLKTFKNAKT